MQVRVISGAHKGSEGKVLFVSPKKQRVIVEGINFIKKSTKPSQENQSGGIVEKEAPIAISNLSLVTADGKTTRLGYRIEDGKKVRVARKTNEAI